MTERKQRILERKQRIQNALQSLWREGVMNIEFNADRSTVLVNQNEWYNGPTHDAEWTKIKNSNQN